MSEVETVALWAGLLTGVASIVLSIVAIVTAFLTDRRTAKVSERTIQALQKIESAVERSSDDTRELIKAAWDKLLGSMDKQVAEPSQLSSKAIVEGIAAELREDLKGLAQSRQSTDPTSPPESERINTLVGNLESSLESLLRRSQEVGRPGKLLDSIIEAMRALSPEAQAIIKAIYGHHLTRSQYQRLLESQTLGKAISELRAASLLVPVTHTHKDGTKEPCYYYPSGMSGYIRAGGAVLPPIPTETEKRVLAELHAAGYGKNDKHERGAQE